MTSPMANNPQTFLNTYLSAIRNTIISLTLGIGIYGFSKSFESQKSSLMMRGMSILLYFYALATGLNTTLMLHAYLRKVDDFSKKEKKEIPDYMDFTFWKVYLTLGYIFCVILVILILVALQRFLRKLY